MAVKKLFMTAEIKKKKQKTTATAKTMKFDLSNTLTVRSQQADI